MKKHKEKYNKKRSVEYSKKQKEEYSVGKKEQIIEKKTVPKLSGEKPDAKYSVWNPSSINDVVKEAISKDYSEEIKAQDKQNENIIKRVLSRTNNKGKDDFSKKLAKFAIPLLGALAAVYVVKKYMTKK